MSTWLTILFFPWISFASLIFLHIPKTGGTTLHYLLEQQYDKNFFYPFKVIPKRYRVSYQEKSRTSVLHRFPTINQEIISGHFPFWFLQEKDPNFSTSFIFTILRDPVERAISHYFYKLNEYSAPTDVQPNMMCKMLCSDITLHGEELLQNALENLQRVNFLIFMDDFEAGIQRLFSKLGLMAVESIPICNPSKHTPLSEAMIEKVRQINDLDVRLYEYAIQNLRYKSY